MELPEGFGLISKVVAQALFLLLVLAFTARYIDRVTVQRRRSFVVGTLQKEKTNINEGKQENCREDNDGTPSNQETSELGEFSGTETLRVALPRADGGDERVRRIRAEQQRALDVECDRKLKLRKERAIAEAQEKYADMTAARTRRILSNGGPVLPGRELGEDFVTRKSEAQKIREQQDADLAESLERDKQREGSAQRAAQKADWARKMEGTKKEERRRRREALEACIPPEPPSEVDGRVVIAVDLERRGRFQRAWLKTHKFSALCYWVECLDAMTKGNEGFSLETVFPRKAFSLEEHGERTLEDLGMYPQCLLRVRQER